MKHFFQTTYPLWIALKLIVAIACFALSFLDDHHSHTPLNRIITDVLFFYPILMVIDIVASLMGHTLIIMTYVTGVISFAIAVVLIHALFRGVAITPFLTIPAIVVFALIAAFDLLQVRRFREGI